MRSSSQSCETGTLSTRCRFTAASFCSAVWYDRVVSDMAGYLRPGYITRPRAAVHFRLRQDMPTIDVRGKGVRGTRVSATAAAEKPPEVLTLIVTAAFSLIPVILMIGYRMSTRRKTPRIFFTKTHG